MFSSLVTCSEARWRCPWWSYQHSADGRVYRGVVRVAVEAVLVWRAVTYGTVILFEVVKVWQASGRGAKQAFLGSS
jgi:hypothetical protein